MWIRRASLFLAFLSLPALAGTASAQSSLIDARTIAMGGAGGRSSNIALSMVPPPTQSGAVIPIPLGLIQVFKGGLDKFKPSSDDFDPVAALELGSSPLHYTFGADATSDSRQNFINDLVNGSLNPDLSATYSGFEIPESFTAEGLLAPQFGKTIKFAKTANRFHGLYVGVGPYLAFDADADIDRRLAEILGDGVRYPNASMLIHNESNIQLAGALTLGYRGRLPLGQSSQSERDGVYVAYNFHIIKGFKYYRPDLSVTFNTDGAGNLTTNTPFSLVSVESDSGTGSASDIGIQIVRGRIQGGFGLNGIGNKINWKDFTQRTFTLANLTAGFDFVETPGTAPFTERKVKLPVAKTANVGFEVGGWGATATVTDGFNGTSFFGGAERRVGKLWLRGGGRYVRGFWDPTFGFGVGSKTALDVGFYGTHANFENERKLAVAASVRIGGK